MPMSAGNAQPTPTLEDTVKVVYDNETDTLSIILRDGRIAESDEPRPGMILDYDKAGRLVSIELLDASDQVKSPQSVEFALAGSHSTG
jgi:YD repeat-containing protein